MVIDTSSGAIFSPCPFTFGRKRVQSYENFFIFQVFSCFFLLKGDENCISVNFVSDILAISWIIPNFAKDKNWKYER